MPFSTLLRPALTLLLLSFALAGHGASPSEAPDKASAALVKAAFLHKFASFVDWPQGSFQRPDSPLRIGVVGDGRIWQELSQLSHDRERDGRPVTVTRVAPGDSLAGLHILYVRAPTAARMTELLAGVPEGVLTVADADGVHPKGSVMSFFLEDGRVRLPISPARMRPAWPTWRRRCSTGGWRCEGRVASETPVALLSRALPLS